MELSSFFSLLFLQCCFFFSVSLTFYYIDFSFFVLDWRNTYLKDITTLLKEISSKPYYCHVTREKELDTDDIQKIFKDAYSFSCSRSYLFTYRDRGIFLILFHIAPVWSAELVLSLLGYPNGDYVRLNHSLRAFKKNGVIEQATLNNTFSRTKTVNCLSAKGFNLATTKMIPNFQLASVTPRNGYEPPIKIRRKKISENASGNLIHELCLGYTMLSFLFSPLTPFFVEGCEVRILSGTKMQRKNSLRIDSILKIGLTKDKNSWQHTIYIEQDQGTETIAKLVDKLDRYCKI